MDKLYEFDREPVSPDKLQSGSRFAGLFAGEHVAATEFVIGAFFVLHGVTARDLILGLFIGNLLAVLSWTFICAPIAVQTRLTLYWYLQKIAGPGLTFLYNIANAFLYCILAGAMVSVASTAVGLGFGIKTPQLTDIYPNSVGWVVRTFLIGVAFTVLAILGFEKLSKFASVCSPWIFVVFIAGAVATLPKLGVNADLSNLWEIANTKVWNGVPTARAGAVPHLATSSSSPGSPTSPCMSACPTWRCSATRRTGSTACTRPSACTPATCWHGFAPGSWWPASPAK